MTKPLAKTSSNKLSEIMLPSNPEETFVCVLSSMNLLHYDEWKDTDAVQILLIFLDTVNEEFIRKGKNIPFIERAVRFAERHKALGLGTLGWASYLQKHMIAFESREAARLNYEIFDFLDKETKTASRKLAEWFGESEITKGTGYRNATRVSIAPTRSSCVTPDTEFLDADGDVIDYYTFCDRGGLDLEEIMSVKIEFEDGTVATYRYDDYVEVEGRQVQVVDLLQ